MSGICRVGVDSAGGIILGGGNSTVFANGALVAVNGDAVQGHGNGVHAGPTMIASSTVFINGKMACKAGNQATCGHAASGSGNVNIG
jgi:uncharacterized Zn-binding protein involved in type VI secretion